MSDDIMSAVPDTPAGRHLRWWRAAAASGGASVTAADAERFAAGPMRERWAPLLDPATATQHWVRNPMASDRTVAVSVETDEPARIVAVIRTEKDRRWRLTIETEAAAPHAITAFTTERVHDFKLEVREAGPADAATCADIETRCPIVLGDVAVWFDRGTRYFDAMRLMDDFTVGLASVDGVPAAVSCGAERGVRVGGVDKRMVVVSHLRVLPEHQRRGLWGAANSALSKYWPRVDGSQAYISVGNLGMQHGFTGTPDKWPTVVQRLELDTAALAGPGLATLGGRAASPADAQDLAARLNAFHGAEELYVPYTAASLAARLERASDLYGWERLWLTQGPSGTRAIAGVWPAGQALRTVTETAGARTVCNPAVALDYACEAGAEAELEALLRAWCAALAADGLDTLVLYTSPHAPAGAMLRALARDVGEFFTWTPGIPVPPGAETRGLYTDAVYF